ncbi:TolB family protein [Vibrio sp. WXL103]|uniref:TolB family protein n=1 Tax=unclassified Vibrio TaxID=2614977 RepID=UPI003EC5A3E2
MKIITSLMLLVFLAGCGAEEQDTEKEFILASIAAREEAEKLANELAEQKRTWVDEFNYFKTLEDGSTPASIQRAELWPLEDLSDESSYDMPRIQFIWNNQMHSTHGEDEQLTKIWSAKIDGSDLRLVSGNGSSWGGVTTARRSPDNRYVAFSKIEKVNVHYLLDIESQKVTKIGLGGEPRFVWSEESRYLYFTENNNRNYKLEIQSGEITLTDVPASKYGVVVNGKVINLNHFGVYVTDEVSGDLEFSITNYNDEGDVQKYSMREKGAISPDGKFAWGSSGLKNFWFDVENSIVESTGQATDKFSDLDLISPDGNYIIRGGYNKNVYRQDLDGKRKLVGNFDSPVIGGNTPRDLTFYNTSGMKEELYGPKVVK